ncbi:MAG: methyltransferase domain-containing protein [Chloroflexi bacterium]|nr:methyltransferase domain-containing protein [Chloroflexota bacterium]
MNPGWRPATEIYADWVREGLRPSSHLLDIGCGRGGLVEQLEHPFDQIVGIDPDWLSLHEHRLVIPRVAALSDYLPFTADSFDMLFASWVLEHLENPERTFMAVGRALRPGGVFVFITPNGRHPLTWLNNGLGRLGQLQGKLVERFYDRTADDAFPTYYRANSEVALEKLCQTAGLQLEKLQPIPDPTYLAFNRPLFWLMCQFETRLPAARKLHLVGLARRP